MDASVLESKTGLSSSSSSSSNPNPPEMDFAFDINKLYSILLPSTNITLTPNSAVSSTSASTSPSSPSSPSPSSTDSLPSLPSLLTDIKHLSVRLNRCESSFQSSLSSFDPLLNKSKLLISPLSSSLSPSSIDRLLHLLSSSAKVSSALSNTVRSLDESRDRVTLSSNRLRCLLILSEIYNKLSVLSSKSEDNYRIEAAMMIHRVFFIQREYFSAAKSHFVYFQIEEMKKKITENSYENIKKYSEEWREKFAKYEETFNNYGTQNNNNNTKSVASSQSTIQSIRTSLISQCFSSKLLSLCGHSYDSLLHFSTARSRLCRLLLLQKGLSLHCHTSNSLFDFLTLTESVIFTLSDFIAQSVKLVQRDFGVGMEIRFLQHFMGEVEYQVTPIIKIFMERRKIKDIANYMKSTQTLAFTPAVLSSCPISLSSIPSLLNEMVSLLSECESFELLLSSLAKTAAKNIESGIIKENTLINNNYNTVTDNNNNKNNNKTPHAKDSHTTGLLTVIDPPPSLLYYSLQSSWDKMKSDKFGIEFKFPSPLQDSLGRLADSYAQIESFEMKYKVMEAWKEEFSLWEKKEKIFYQRDPQEDINEDNEDNDTITSFRDNAHATHNNNHSSLSKSSTSSAVSSLTAQLSSVVSLSSTDNQIFFSGIGSVRGVLPFPGYYSPSVSPSGNVSPLFFHHVNATLSSSSSSSSTLISDLFLSLKSSFDRSLDTVHFPAICGVCNFATKLLSEDINQRFLSVVDEYKGKWIDGNQNNSGGGLMNINMNLNLQHLSSLLTASSSSTSSSSSQSSSSSSSPSLSVSSNPSRHLSSRKLFDDFKLLVCYNHLDSSMENFAALRLFLKEKLSLSTSQGDVTYHYFNSNLSEFQLSSLEETQKVIENTLMKYCEIIVSTLTPKIQQILNKYKLSQYDSSTLSSSSSSPSSGFSLVDSNPNDPLIFDLLSEYRLSLFPFRHIIRPLAFTRLLNHSITYLVTELEKIFMGKENGGRKVGLVGAMMIDKEIRKIYSEINKLVETWRGTAEASQAISLIATADASSSSSILNPRSHFSRLIQFCGLLTLDRLSDFGEWKNNQAGRSKINANEIKNILQIRADFNAKEIQSMNI